MAKFLMMAMSLRKDSLNKKLILHAQQSLKAVQGSHDFEVLSLSDYLIPLYDGDLEAQTGIPDTVKRLGDKIMGARGLILSSPEYNGGISGVFKNTIDWISRLSPMPWSGKQILLLAASPGGLGGVRGLGHSRVPLESLGAFVYPEMFGLAQAHQAFDEASQLKDPATAERFNKLLKKFTNHASSLP